LAAREDSERLLRMINDLLDLTKLESGETGLPPTIMSPRALVESSVKDLRDFVEARGARLIVNIAPDLLNIAADPHQIDHVFTNFVSNAIRYTKPGQEIILQVKPHGGGVRFSVIDQGPGIPLEYQPRIFERFFRVPGSDSGGAGLGLAIAKEIVAVHGGTVGVHSKPGNGSEFYFDLPAATKV
jgi:signal transduction histidine kinase